MPGPSDAQKAVEEFQRLMAAQDARASASVVRAYAPVYRQLQKDTQALVRIAKEQGLKPWQVGRMDRMKDLNRQFLAGTAKFANAAGIPSPTASGLRWDLPDVELGEPWRRASLLGLAWRTWLMWG